MKPINWVAKTLFTGLLFFGATPAFAVDARLFVAASLGEVISELAISFETETGRGIVIVPGASSTLSKQILSGAPADGFISANRAYAEIVASDVDGALFDLFGNRLVLIAPDGYESPTEETDIDLATLPAFLGEGRLAIGDPAHVPAGIYARQALQALGIWEGVEHRLAPAGDVRGAALFVARGAAPFGVTYQTDAALEGVKIVARFDADLHDPIRYWGVVTNDENETADLFFTYLISFKSQVLLDYYGFDAVMSLDE